MPGKSLLIFVTLQFLTLLPKKLMNFIEELRWRGMIQDIMPGTDEQLAKEQTIAYVGIDPTADSLHIGHLVSVMMLKHFQLKGHKPIALIGGATGMIGDPSGKSEERKLLDEEVLRHNENAIRQQLLRFLDFDEKCPNRAVLVNNYDWTHSYKLLDFLREIGKHLTINYMMAKDSVQKRLESGLSFTEFTYQLLQAYDFLYLYENYGCKLQMGGSDQWGNITSGTELIRRKTGGEAFALTCPLITKADGGKFGKTEEGNIWLDPRYTSPYRFVQFWLNVSDLDAEKYIRIFTLLPKEEIESLIVQHRSAPHERLLQHRLAKEITIFVHSEDEYRSAMEATRILFGGNALMNLESISEKYFLDAMEGVPHYSVNHDVFAKGIEVVELLATMTQVFPSKADCRRMIQGGGLFINKEKVLDDKFIITRENLLKNRYLLVQKGRKNYILVIAVQS